MTTEVKPHYDFFVSYAEADSAWVEGFLLDALAAAGVQCTSESAFALGAPRLTEFERAVRSSTRTLLILSPAYLADDFGVFTDLLAQTYGLATATWPVVPVLLQAVDLPPRLAMLKGLDARDPTTWPRVVAQLCAAAGRPVPGPTPKPPCPYPGLVPFATADATHFYGRTTEIARILQHLRHDRFLLVIGPSGSGKSSLIYAGLLAQLDSSGFWPPGSWLIRTMRPGEHPVQTLAATLAATTGPPAAVISALLGANAPSQQLLLVVDQFEELFTQAERAEQSRFISAIGALQADPRCTVILTMRADFYPELMNSALWPVDPSRRLEVAVLRGDALRQAIQQPAEAVGACLEAGLVERLLADAADEPGALPLLQETMVLLWAAMQRRLLPLQAYLQLGSGGRSGLAVALATKADATLAALPPDRQRIARRIFLRLVQFGEGRADVRRQQSVAELQSQTDDPPVFAQTLQYLADNRLLTLSGAAEGSRRMVDIAHEALIAGWPILSGWLIERRDAEITRRRLEAKAREWQRLGAATGGLLDEIELREADRWLAGSDATELGYDATLPQLVEQSRAVLAQAAHEKEAAAQEKEAARQRELQQARALAAEQQQRARTEAQARRRLQGLVAALLALVIGTSTVTGFVAYRTLVLPIRARSELVPIPAGRALIGSADPDLSLPDSQPITVTLKAFTIERYEVANWQYGLCVEAGACVPPLNAQTAKYYFNSEYKDHPVNGVTVLQAAAYCHWIGRRLPSEFEWERAARGPVDKARLWPWGSGDPTMQRANVPVEGVYTPTGTLPVNSNVQGATPDGIFNLYGNVWEWTASYYTQEGYSDPAQPPSWNGDPATLRSDLPLVERGDSWQVSVSIFRRNPAVEEVATEGVGIRCAAAP